MSYMFEVYYQSPADSTKEATLTDLVRSHGGNLDYREAPELNRPGSICLTFEFGDRERALAAAERLRRQGEHVGGPQDYGP